MRLTVSAVAVVTMLGLGYVTLAAQPQRDDPTQTVDVRNDRDNGFDIGWLGLIGLAGLLGMKRSDKRDRTVTRSDSTVASPVR